MVETRWKQSLFFLYQSSMRFRARKVFHAKVALPTSLFYILVPQKKPDRMRKREAVWTAILLCVSVDVVPIDFSVS